MADNLFNKVDDVEQKVADTGRRVEDTNKKIDEVSAKVNNIEQYMTNMSTVHLRSNDRANFNLFIRNADKYYQWGGPYEEFLKEKKYAMFFLIGYIIFCIITSFLTTTACHIYSTFTFFENIWCFLSIFLLFYVYKSKYTYEMYDYVLHSYEKFESSANMIEMKSSKNKKKYKVFYILNIISILCNIIYMIIEFNHLCIIGIIFEALTAVSFFFSWRKVDDIFVMYDAILFVNKDVNGCKKAFLFQIYTSKWYTDSDYKKEFPWTTINL